MLSNYRPVQMKEDEKPQVQSPIQFPSIAPPSSVAARVVTQKFFEGIKKPIPVSPVSPSSPLSSHSAQNEMDIREIIHAPLIRRPHHLAPMSSVHITPSSLSPPFESPTSVDQLEQRLSEMAMKIQYLERTLMAKIESLERRLIIKDAIDNSQSSFQGHMNTSADIPRSSSSDEFELLGCGMVG
jgi:hypothetical protein